MLAPAVVPPAAARGERQRGRDEQGEGALAPLGLAPASGGSPVPEPQTPFGQQLQAAMGSAVAYMRAQGVIEVEDEAVEGLVAELVGVALEAHSPKQMMKRISRTLIQSDHVEEVFGSDDEISSAVKRFLEPE